MKSMEQMASNGNGVLIAMLMVMSGIAGVAYYVYTHINWEVFNLFANLNK